MLRKALQDAGDRGYLGRNVADLANPPTQRDARSVRARDKAWTGDQLRTFFGGTSGDRLAPLWQLVATTGLRRGELCGVRWSDVDLDRGRLVVSRTLTETSAGLVEQVDGKTDAAQRSIALDRQTIETLRAWRTRQTEARLAAGPAWTNSGFVFTREDGTSHRPKRLSSMFTEATDRLDLPRIGLHGVRHSYATLALRAGVSPEVVSKRLGHASVVITLTIYAHVFEQDDQAAAEQVAAAIYGA
jgi:integrase